MLSLIIIIIISIFIYKYLQLKVENKELKEKLELISNKLIDAGIIENKDDISFSQNKQLQASQYFKKMPLSKYEIEPLNKTTIKEQVVNNEQTIAIKQTIIKETPKIKKEKSEKEKKEQRNISILVTGATCIVLSAVVFLMSTWNFIPDFLKTVVLALLVLVFFGGSHIAKEKFKLNKVSITFFYMAMAYIPICFFSICVFRLFGNYLSIYGEGRYIYLMFSSMLIAFIYYFVYVKKNDIYLLYGSLLSQAFSIVALSLIFAEDVFIIAINLLLYNILLIFVTKKDIFGKIYNFIPAIVAVLTLPMLMEQRKNLIFVFALLTINFLILEFKNLQKIHLHLANASFSALGLYSAFVFTDILGQELSYMMVIGSVILLHILENLLLFKSNRQHLLNPFAVIAILTLTIPLALQQKKSIIFALALLAINFLILELKNSQKIYSYSLNISLVLSGLYTSFAFYDVMGKDLSHLFAISYTVLLYIIENIVLWKSNRKNLINSLTVVTLSTIAILHVESFVLSNIISPYIISIVQIILLAITYIKSEYEQKCIIAKLLPAYFIVTGLNIIYEINGSYHVYVLFSLFTFIVGEIFRKRDTIINSNTFIISHIFVAFTYITAFITNIYSFIDDVFYAVLLTALYAYSYLAEKNIVFKYIALFVSKSILFTLFNFINVRWEALYYVPMLNTLIILGVRNVFKNFLNNTSSIYLEISKILSFTLIYIPIFYSYYEISTILAILFTIIIIIDNIIRKQPDIWNIVPLACVWSVLFFNNLNTELKIGIMLISVLTTTGMSLKEKNISIFTIFSGIYLFFTALNIESIYLKEILFICWSVVHFLFITLENYKNIFKFLSYLSTLFLYNSIIFDLQLNQYTLFSMLGYILLTILTIRTIIIKYTDNIDILEYILFGTLYLVALLQYKSEVDGMLFGILLVVIVITSYIKKYGALFMVSISAILVNVFLLTRKFWLSVPWWVYLLFVGTALIAFAVKNEVSDKKNEMNPIEILKNIKDKIEK